MSWPLRIQLNRARWCWPPRCRWSATWSWWWPRRAARRIPSIAQGAGGGGAQLRFDSRARAHSLRCLRLDAIASGCIGARHARLMRLCSPLLAESLWRNGSRAEAYFHQNCGAGARRARRRFWPPRTASDRASRGLLVSRTDPYCQRAGSSEWSATVSRAELTQALAAAGLAAPG